MNRHTRKDGTMCFWNLVTMGPRRQWQRFCETKRRLRRGCADSSGDELALHQQVKSKTNKNYTLNDKFGGRYQTN